MFQRNVDLFSDLTSFEKLFIRPEELPWFALMRMIELLQEKSGGLDVRSRIFPSIGWPNEVRVLDAHVDIKTPLVLISIERSVYVFGGEGLKSDPDVHIQGPLVFGKNVTLRKGAVVTGPGYIGDNVTIGQQVRFRRSFVRANSEIVFGTRVSNAAIGMNVRVGSNVALDDEPDDGASCVSVSDGMGTRVRTPLSHLGCMVGDRSRIGCGSVIGSGVSLPPGSKVKSGVCRRK